MKSYITFWYWSPIFRSMIAPVIQIMDKIFKVLRMKNQPIESQNSRYNTSITYFVLIKK